MLYKPVRNPIPLPHTSISDKISVVWHKELRPFAYMFYDCPRGHVCIFTLELFNWFFNPKDAYLAANSPTIYRIGFDTKFTNPKCWNDLEWLADIKNFNEFSALDACKNYCLADWLLILSWLRGDMSLYEIVDICRVGMVYGDIDSMAMRLWKCAITQNRQIWWQFYNNNKSRPPNTISNLDVVRNDIAHKIEVDSNTALLEQLKNLADSVYEYLTDLSNWFSAKIYEVKFYRLFMLLPMYYPIFKETSASIVVDDFYAQFIKRILTDLLEGRIRKNNPFIVIILDWPILDYLLKSNCRREIEKLLMFRNVVMWR